MKYLVLPRLEVKNANAQPSIWLVTAPAPTAYMGFAHNVGRMLGAAARGVVIVHHDYALRAERIKHEVLPHQFRAASLINSTDYASSNRYALSLQPQARCDVVVSLGIAFDDDAAIPMSQLHAWLPAARVAGGTLDSWAKPAICLDMSALRARVGYGWAVRERADLMACQPHERDRLDALLRATHASAYEVDPWVMPTLLGYRAITPFARRSRARDDYPHAFAEPLIGLIQYESLRQLRDERLLWRYTQPTADTFVVTTEPQRADERFSTLDI